MEEMCRVWINNVPAVVERFIVARLSKNELWYWGSWADKENAEKVAKEIGGIVAEVGV